MVKIRLYEHYIFKYHPNSDIIDDNISEILKEYFNTWGCGTLKDREKQKKKLTSEFKKIMNSNMFTINYNYSFRDYMLLNVFSKKAATLLRVHHPDIEMAVKITYLNPKNDGALLFIAACAMGVISSIIYIAGCAHIW